MNKLNSENDVLNFWQDSDSFRKSLENPTLDKNYIFYDGPPFANGLPHYGHLLTGFVKDTFARYHTMLGERCERKFGWDCHGLPAEMEAEKELKVSGRADIKKYGIDKFNEHCKKSVMKYSSEWEYYVTRQGRWVDFTHSYKTMDLEYMESVIWAFKKLFDKGLIYEATRVVPYSWKCETPLSNFETRMDNSYREKESKSVTVKFELIDFPTIVSDKISNQKIYALVWTTTPWTLPSNLALAVNSDVEYSLVSSISKKEIYIIASSLIPKYSKNLGEVEVISKIEGSHLTGLSYKPLFPYFKDTKNAFKVLNATFVTTDDGTGIVHIAPGFGEDDKVLCDLSNIETICPVDDGGKFTPQMHDLKYSILDKECILNISGKQVFDTNDDIIKYLKSCNLWIKTEQYIHNYPHCWRTDTPLIYKAVPSWYVEVTKFKDRMFELNQQINWIPSHIRDGQFGKWIEGARDWSISRNRFFGCPIPVWKSNNPNNKKLYVFGSIAELEDFFGQKITNLHRHYVDKLTQPDPEDPNYTISRVEDVLDCWFESGAMPFASIHYPFNQKSINSQDGKPANFPADFIVEYVAQTRGWFYTLMVLSTALFDYIPFKNCICHGVILDENSQKLSKRLRNYPDPKEMFELHGSDAMRFLMLKSPVMYGQELNIDKNGTMIKDVNRIVINAYLNSSNFLLTYANMHYIKCNPNITYSDIMYPMNRYIINFCKIINNKIVNAMNVYDAPLACNAFEEFLENLNNWYIRRSKSYFILEKCQEHFDTLSYVLQESAKFIAPILPFTAEIVYQNIKQFKKNTG